MIKHGLIVCKLHLCLPKGPTNFMNAYYNDHSIAAAVFANGTYFVDMSRT
jgi:hypothetical protein